jgi:hypothetical protein
MIRKRRSVVDPVEDPALELVLEPALELVLDPTLEPALDPTKVVGDLLRAADLAKDRVLEPALDPLEVAGDLPTEIVAGDLSVELVAVSLYHQPALSSSDWNCFFISSVDDVEEQFLKNDGKPIKICYLSSLVVLSSFKCGS